MNLKTGTSVLEIVLLDHQAVGYVVLDRQQPLHLPLGNLAAAAL